MSPPPWPDRCRFAYGQGVRRCDRANGKPPLYRFVGIVCGWYINPGTPDGEPGLGYAIASVREPGCVQIFPESQLEALEP